MVNEICDFEYCKKYNTGICIATDPEQCPKNNDESVYENSDLIKEVSCDD